MLDLDPGVQNGLAAAAGAGAGAGLKALVDWWVRRSERRETREETISRLNDELAEKLRTEIRADNLRLTAQVATLQGQMLELNRVNEALRKENLDLMAQIGRETYRMGEQARVMTEQALQISVLQNDLGLANSRIGVLESILRQANVPVPEPARRRSDTGPLKAGV